MTIRANRVEILFGSSIFHNHTVYSTGCYDKCFKNREHQKLFLDTTYGAEIDGVIFPGFQADKVKSVLY